MENGQHKTYSGKVDQKQFVTSHIESNETCKLFYFVRYSRFNVISATAFSCSPAFRVSFMCVREKSTVTAR